MKASRSSRQIQPHAVGLAFGLALGLWHLCWSVLVAVGLAQPLMDVVFQLHMIQVAYMVLPFSLTSGVMLVIITTLFGYVIGYILGLLWNIAIEK